MKKHLLPHLILIGLTALALRPVQAEAPQSVQPAQNLLPLHFVENVGQTDTQVRFEARGLGGNLFFTPQEVVFTLPASQPDSAMSVMRLHFDAANPDPAVEGMDRLSSTVNYFNGANPSGWHTNIATYSGIVYRRLYPGIDLIYDGTDGLLKGTFTVAPGVNPYQIRWRYQGSTAAIDPQTGDLHIALEDGAVLVERAPIAWQQINDRSIPVDVQFKTDMRGVGFQIGSYDPTHELIIDPVLEYSTFIGGSEPDDAWGIDADDNGFAYVTGRTESPDFPGASGGLDNTVGSQDAFVVKINTNVTGPNSLVWATYLGGAFNTIPNIPGGDEGWDIAVDDDGNVYVTGTTGSIDFPVTPSGFQLERGQGFCCTIDAFLTKISPDGSQILYSTYIGGRFAENGYSVDADSNGNAYVGGTTSSGNFITTPNGYDTINTQGQSSIFIVKIDTTASGINSLIYSTYFGNGPVNLNSLAVDETGNVYFTGSAQTQNFPTTPNAYQPNFNDADAYVSRLDTTQSGASALIYSTFFGGSDAENFNFGVSDIATDGEGFAYITGETSSPDLPTINGFQLQHKGDSDAFVARFDTNASGAASLLYSTYLGGSNFDQGYGIAATRNGNVYVTGQARSVNFPVKDPITLLAGNGTVGSFVTKIDTTLTGQESLIYSTFLGKYGNGYGGAAVDSNGTAYVAGQIGSNAFPIVGGFQTTYAGETDGYMAKLSFRSDLEITKIVEPEVTVIGEPIHVTITVKGKGPETATGVILTEFLPEDMFTFISAIPEQGECNYALNVIRCDLGHIEKQQVVIVEVIVVPILPSGPLALASTNISAAQDEEGSTLIATVDGVERDDNSANNTVERNVLVYTFDTFVPVLLSPSSSVSDTTPTFRWQTIPGAVSYELQYSRGDVTAIQAVPANTNSYTPSVSLLTTDYDWRVRGVGAGSTFTEWSNIASVTITAASSAGPQRTLFETNAPTLSWGRVSWATGYEIEVDNNSNFSSPEFENDLLGANDFSVTTTPLPDGDFFWRVRAKRADGTWGAWSKPDTFLIRSH